MRNLLVPAAIVAAAFAPQLAAAQSMPFAAKLAPAAGVASTGAGTATLSLDAATKVLTYRVEYSGLTGPATAAHIHAAAQAGGNGPPVVPFASPASPASPITGTATLTDAQVADLHAGKWYVNVHTAANKGGEIRGDIRMNH